MVLTPAANAEKTLMQMMQQLVEGTAGASTNRRVPQATAAGFNPTTGNTF